MIKMFLKSTSFLMKQMKRMPSCMLLLRKLVTHIEALVPKKVVNKLKSPSITEVNDEILIESMCISQLNVTG